MASSSRAIASLLSLMALASLPITSAVSIPIATPSSLLSGDYLRPDGRIIRSGFRLVMRDRDCKLVLYDHSFHKIWQSENNGGGKACRAGLEHHGTLIILNRKNEKVWKSENRHHQGTYPYEVFINDRNAAVEIRDKFHYIMWSSKDHIKP
ncbi:uncharacterized protein LOC110022957 [Phalaenopsis equestris]|uniref:uncharacterized protein LOC110022957 n=1 Tax=Phalaenopsis equestris TaxID=78828 RepID=UPI0009E65662|nr:uncharacterized protein LOC110022957 [Phalaenopsis equestris]